MQLSLNNLSLSGVQSVLSMFGIGVDNLAIGGIADRAFFRNERAIIEIYKHDNQFEVIMTSEEFVDPPLAQALQNLFPE